MKKLGVVLALGLAAFAGACGDNNSTPDAPITPIHDSSVVDTMTDAPVVAATLTSYVKDLVLNHTNNTDLPRAFTEFSTLPDPDQTSNNLAAYSSLFP